MPIFIILAQIAVAVSVYFVWIFRYEAIILEFSKFGLTKSHYKFYYSPATSSLSGNEYILLDILFEKHHYGIHTQEIEISSPFIQTTESNLKVTIPIPEAILGDKLTAFAPNTTGIPYEKGKEIEIIKQLYDIGNLFDLIKKKR